jgi:hypothetical protein
VAAPLILLLKVNQSAAESSPVLVMLAVGRFKVRELVVVEMLKMFPAVPVEMFWLRRMLFRAKEEVFKLWLASVVTKELAVRVAMFKLPRGEMVKRFEPVPLSNWARLEVWEVEAWTIKLTVEEPLKFSMWSKAVGAVVPRPMLLPLSYSKELAVVEAPEYLTK